MVMIIISFTPIAVFSLLAKTNKDFEVVKKEDHIDVLIVLTNLKVYLKSLI